MRLRNVLILAAALMPPVAAMAADQQPDNAMIITIQDENASLSTSPLTDRFYTNGLRLGWTGPTGQVPNFLHDIGDTLWGPSMQRISVDVTQQMYTPADTQASVPDPHIGLMNVLFLSQWVAIMVDVANASSIGALPGILR